VVVEDPAKPVPVTVMFDPTMLLVGLRRMDGEIVNIELADSDVTSDATTLCTPLIDSEATKVALNDPVVDVATVLGEVARVVPSYVMVTVEDASKPVPVTVMIVPTAPLDGLSVIDAPTVKEVDADWDRESVAVTRCAPKVEAGTVKDTENAPILLEVTVATVDDPKVIVTVDVAVKLVPETVTDVATGPELGLSEIPGISW